MTTTMERTGAAAGGRQAEFEVMMRAAMAKVPALTIAGVDAKVLYRHGPTMTAELQQKFERERADLLLPHSIEQFARVYDWLMQWPKRQTINRSGTSYGLKHVAERDVGYSTNGVFIAAGVAAGFRVEFPIGGVNAFFNITQRAWGKRVMGQGEIAKRFGVR